MAAKSFELSLPFTSRFKRTALYLKGGRAFFGLWWPLAVKLDGDEEQMIVSMGQEGQLDQIAYEVYGDRSLWPVIAHANKIDLPHEQVVVGRRLIVPKPANVNAALLATIARQSAKTTEA